MGNPVHTLKSRIGNLRKYLPDAKLSLYAISDRSFQTFCMVGIATCAEQMLELCHEAGLRDWTLGNTNCRSIIRNVEEDGPRLLTVVTLKRSADNGSHAGRVEQPPAKTSIERTRARKERRQRAKERARLAKLERRGPPDEEKTMTAQVEPTNSPLS